MLFPTKFSSYVLYNISIRQLVLGNLRRRQWKQCSISSDVFRLDRDSNLTSDVPKSLSTIAGGSGSGGNISFTPTNKKTADALQNEIRTLLKTKKLKSALHLFEVQRREDKVKPLRGMFAMLIGACGNAGYTKKAFNLYNDMKKGGWKASVSIYTSLFNACANSPWADEAIQRALRLKQQINDENVTMNSALYHSMIKAFGRLGDFGMVIELVKEMNIKGVPLTTETFNFLFQSCISFPQDGYQRALLVWRKMRNLNVTPDLFSYNLLLRSARDCEIGHGAAVEPLFSDFLDGHHCMALEQEHSVEKASISARKSNSFSAEIELQDSVHIFHHSNINQNRLSPFGGMVTFLQKMEEDGVIPNIKTLTLLLEVAISDRHHEDALIKCAEKFSVNLDLSFFNILIKKRNLRRDFDGVKDAMKILKMKKLHPNVMTCGVLAMGCRTLRDAKLFLDDMETANFRLNVEIFGTLLSNAIAQRDFQYIIYLMNRTTEKNLEVDEKALRMLEDFKNNTIRCIGKYDRGHLLDPIYGQEEFRKAFKSFCFNYERWLKKSSTRLDGHPWEQYRYSISANT